MNLVTTGPQACEKITVVIDVDCNVLEIRAFNSYGTLGFG